MATLFFLLYLIITLGIFARGLNALIWDGVSILYLIIATFFIGLAIIPGLLIWLIIVGILAFKHIPFIQHAFSQSVFSHAKKATPKLSQTEEAALNAGDTWVEQSIFRGEPDWKHLSNIQSSLTNEEQDFLDNETEKLCEMLDDWTITQEQDLPKAAWDFIKSKGFLGLVIEKNYGGKGFSARAHSEIVMKIASRCGVAAVTVMVPNSLGPGELLHHYGTDDQKSNYLPKLADGREIPCFALTEPEAGSDATSIQAEAIVMERSVKGKKVLGLNLTFSKRWITLAPVATLIGLAVNLRDPDGLLNGVGREGITCLLIPRQLDGLDIGNRHIPAAQPFMNGTIRGKDVFVPIDSIIGGQKEAGRGWQMLVECLSIGRSISLPALGAASSSIAYLTTSAYARIRRQFSVELVQFEGIQEKLAQIAGINYIATATRLLTVSAVDHGLKPSVASAITKYFNTELPRMAINASMDVHGGRTVVCGPRNYMSNFYQGIPISVTVEGANIMTRNLLVFGQGAMACHPYLREEFYALAKDDAKAFSHLLSKHIQYFIRNLTRTLIGVWSNAYVIPAPKHPMRRDCQRLSRLSYALAWISDCALIILGGDLKRKERLSARLGDGMSYLYLAMAVLKQVEVHGGDETAKLHARWALDYCFYHATQALIGVCHNFPMRWVGRIMKWIAFPFGGAAMPYPSDKTEYKLTQSMVSNHTYRDGLKDAVYVGKTADEPVARVELALQQLIEAKPIYDKLKGFKRLKAGQIKPALEQAVEEGIITKDEMKQVLLVEKSRWDAVQVDEFEFESMKKKSFSSIIDTYENPIH